MISYTDVSAAEAKQLIENNPELIVIDVSPHYNGASSESSKLLSFI